MFVVQDATQLKGLIQAGTLALILCLEFLFPLFKDRRARLKHIGRNLSIGLANGLILTLLSPVFT